MTRGSRLLSFLRSPYLWIMVVLFIVLFWSLPVVHITAPYSKILLDRNGQLLSARIAKDEQWRFPPEDKSYPIFETALIHTEDKRFSNHWGVDPLAILRAIRLNFRHGAIKSGGSTLTMQVVRIARGNPKRIYSEKLYEMFLALRLEQSKTKAEILHMYIHNAPFGGNIVGVEAAAWRYFARPPEELSWAESSMLAVLPNNPALVHISRNRSRLQEKRDILLRKLHEAGHFSEQDLALYLLEPIPRKPKALPQKTPHLMFRPEKKWRIQTTIDKQLQEQVDQVIARHAIALKSNRIHNISALMIDTASAEVLAYVGNTLDFSSTDHGNHVDIVHARRSTGSLLKPFLYYSMLQEGELLPDEIIPDIPMNINGFAPQNFDRGYKGALPASLALARSRNIPAAWMLKNYGVERWYAELESWGMTTLHRKPDDYGLALILGGAEGTLWEMTSMYHNLAWSAEFHEEGRSRPALTWKQRERRPSEYQKMNPVSSWFVIQALKKVNRPQNSRIQPNTKENNVAWKTGTSYGFRDAWSIGFDPQTVVAVWVGNADSEGRADLTGHKAAAPILFDLLALRKSQEDFD